MHESTHLKGILMGEIRRRRRSSHSSSSDAPVYGLNTKKSSGKRHHHHHRRSGNTALKVVGIILAVLLVVGGAAGYAGYKLYNEAQDAMATAKQMKAQVPAIKQHVEVLDFNALYDDVTLLNQQSATLEKQTSGPLWKLASFVPAAGRDIKSAIVLSQTAEDLSAHAIDLLGKLTHREGYENAGTTEILKSASALSTSIDVAIPKVAGLKHGQFDQINEVVDLLNEELPKAAVIGHFVGSEGDDRRYLILPQSNVEIRSTGGFLGSWGTIWFKNDGTMELGNFIRAVVKLDLDPDPWYTEDELSYFSGLDVLLQATVVNTIPDFERVASIEANYWDAFSTDEFVDGVISLDPVVLQRLLSVIGSVTTDDGTEVNGENAAQLIMHDVYNKYESNDQQDAFFAEVATKAFRKIVDNLGSVDLGAVIDVIKQSGEDGRLLLWMKSANEQEVIRKTGFSGAIPADPAKPQLGVYANNWGFSKMDWYLDLWTDVSDSMPNDDGSVSYDVTTHIRNAITPEEPYSLPDYIMNHNDMASTKASLFEYMLLMAPEGGSISDVYRNGEWIDPAQDSKSGRQASGTLYNKNTWQVLVDVPPSSQVDLTYRVTTAPGATEPLTVHQTPTARTFD